MSQGLSSSAPPIPDAEEPDIANPPDVRAALPIPLLGVVIPGITAPKTSFSDPVEPVALALAQERTVTDQISRLVGIARGDGDLIAEQYLQWFLKEQLEEMSSMSALLRTVERANAVNILLAEDHLARAAGAADGAEADAPRAAGGAL